MFYLVIKVTKHFAIYQRLLQDEKKKLIFYWELIVMKLL